MQDFSFLSPQVGHRLVYKKINYQYFFRFNHIQRTGSVGKVLFALFEYLYCRWTVPRTSTYTKKCTLGTFVDADLTVMIFRILFKLLQIICYI
jgi:hypothetical protein